MEIGIEFSVTRNILLVVLVFLLPAAAQVPVDANLVSVVNDLFDGKEQSKSLKCSFEKREPVLDFSFRYHAGFMVEVPVRDLPPGDETTAYLRVTPEGGSPTLLFESFQVPDYPPGLSAKILDNLHLVMSGGFAVGEGRYSVEALLRDTEGHSCRKRWDMKAHTRRKQPLPLALKPDTVAPLIGKPWDGELKEDGLRVTVLLHATPMDPRMSKLYAWDQAFLLQTLSSLLERLPVESVRLVAFNLDSQEEIFRRDELDEEGFIDLMRTLAKVQLGTVSYKSLQRQGWPELLVKLVHEQTASGFPSDAVIFLGPTTHFDRKLPDDVLKDVESGGPPFFYFEYYPRVGADFPDSIDYLTHDLHGTVFKIHAPDQLGPAIQKLLTTMQQPSHAPAGMH